MQMALRHLLSPDTRGYNALFIYCTSLGNLEKSLMTYEVTYMVARLVRTHVSNTC